LGDKNMDPWGDKNMDPFLFEGIRKWALSHFGKRIRMWILSGLGEDRR